MTLDLSRVVDEEGYATAPDVLQQEEVAKLLAETGNANLARSRAGVRHAMKVPCIQALANDQQMMSIARTILGGKAFAFRATLFEKLQTANWLVVWHQDTALPLKARHETPGWGPWSVKDGVKYAHAPAAALSEVIALRVHLDDSMAGNGPLRVLPRTHKLGVLSDEQLHEYSIKVIPVDCLVPKGGVLAMRPLSIHASSKSQTARPRRVVHIEYAASAKVSEELELAIA
jgi:ectoine hydroxylase-related dioxygenase (phytanoyl-CoA dioxygenase family)